MTYLHEIAAYFNMLSDKADEIRKLDRDKYKHYTDMQIFEEIIDDKIKALKNIVEVYQKRSFLIENEM
ncbi:hypothetical protein KDN24_05595 [Bacillus sp. Bva_UNVM-123]|uniref:hypothetical protein n=1 Tax=Bacillus sp. Bva_UNVM-123 TaxID=2829798 RepID=UPI00391F502E